jgi:hypothetical protein
MIDNRRQRPDRKRCPYCKRWYFVQDAKQVNCRRPECRLIHAKAVKREYNFWYHRLRQYEKQKSHEG